MRRSDYAAATLSTTDDRGVIHAPLKASKKIAFRPAKELKEAV
jgi:hypothetical protein